MYLIMAKGTIDLTGELNKLGKEINDFKLCNFFLTETEAKEICISQIKSLEQELHKFRG